MKIIRPEFDEKNYIYLLLIEMK